MASFLGLYLVCIGIEKTVVVYPRRKILFLVFTNIYSRGNMRSLGLGTLKVKEMIDNTGQM